ncbi:MAG: sensor domain-containing diguanylate cyclase [Chloroflexi bacterium]|nr:sensor domain-containing diguanylate cyclase [Chloroflexota bacterium]
MSTDVDLLGHRDDLLTEGPPPYDIAIGDFLKDVRRVKRLTRMGVYSCILVTEPVYYFVLNFSLLQLLVGFVVGLVIATTAIEGAFAEIFKLRKRSAYPGAVALQLGALPTFDVACQATVSIMDKLLHLKGSFLTLQTESGFLSLVALSNLSRAEADRYLRLGAASIKQVLSSKEPVVLHPDRDLLAEAIVTPGKQVVFVPVQSFQRVVGVLGLLADESNSDVRDWELLSSLGTAIGVSLESLRQRDELRTLATIDDLTKVYNRRYFFDQLDHEIAASRRYAMSVSVLTFDLDGLKDLNDNFGHGLGDEALRSLAQRLVRYSRAPDIVARLGGDEFAVILPRTDSAGAADLAKRLQGCVEGDVLLGGEGRELRLRVSCGCASFPEDADDASMLLRQADGRMYAAKAARARKRSK